MFSSLRSRNASVISRSLLHVAVATALALPSAAVFAQATSGTIFGSAPAAAGESIRIESASGQTRTVDVDASGRYTIPQVQNGTYKVSLLKDGAVIDSRDNISVVVGRGSEVSFAGAAGAAQAQDLQSVTVSANTLPAIDVSSVDARTVVTSQELAKYPLGRTAEAIALLAPGVVPGSSYFQGPTRNALASFSGSSVTENAYYINGFNTTDPVSGFGGITLPYNVIDQQEVLTGGYSAAYGRSDGGVISQIGKRGSNEWHFGAQVLWTPRSLKGDQKNTDYTQGPNAGKIYRQYDDNKSWVATTSAYVSGPLIKDKLFFFLAGEYEKTEGNSVGAVTLPYNTRYSYRDPRYYGKLDWNITDNHHLEATFASSKDQYAGNLYDFDYSTRQTGAYNSGDTSLKNSGDLGVLKYTGYITDDLTISAMWGKLRSTYFSQIPGYDPTLPYISGRDQQNPAIGTNLGNTQTVATFTDPRHTSRNTNLRFDVSYHIGDHLITAGIDNQTVRDLNDGDTTSGPGYEWIYQHLDPATPILDNGTAFVDAPGNYANGGQGYIVGKQIYQTAASVKVTQRAQYIEDAWQVDDRWLVKIGLRNDQFTNYNPDGIAYLKLTSPQWAPRLGVSWDVNGDSSMKVFANLGRYYLALPASVALRSAGSSLYTTDYFTYSGIDSQGVPQGLTHIDSSTGGPVSGNAEYGQPRDPKTAASSNLKSEFQDEAILGFQTELTPEWNAGAKLTWRKLRNAIDDVADAGTILAKAESLGYDVDPANVQGGYLFNPGRSNTFKISDGNGGYYDVPVSNADFGFQKLKRKYYGIDLTLEHPFDGKWQAKAIYTFSRSYGNSEGQVKSDIGQEDISATQDWDFASLMSYANGAQSNDQKHVLKLYGSYQFNPEWMVGAVISLASGKPRTCLGYYGEGETAPAYPGPYYHWCGGQPSPPGTYRYPWQKNVSLNAEYRPSFADHKLAFNVMVYNVFNQRAVTTAYPYYGSSAAPLSRYDSATYRTTPRYVRFGMTYDF
ncbi:TonB-dependent receptor [Luteibacter pinisoli]|uniref:TonB-dependent receptor n=1 Tax=Luteibacter pinisoli TaxID=2589080 RepID=A0A4Y5Z8P3_9GAMM|nr:TonB-dependent receptor [Luteibacter pinisoli]QDE41336.1 TonB-dependent receptor [Luteibacter pinisoli]